MKIGVFDSGIGGKHVAGSLKKDFPQHEIIYVNDSDNVPYGGRKELEIITLTDYAIQPLIMNQCQIIVLACNTATAAAIEVLRGKYPSIQFIGLEPMVKSAATITKSGTIGVCATPYTLQSDRYLSLKNKYAGNLSVLEPDCSKWAYMIEHNQIDDANIFETVEKLCSKGADVIVLACTHYHWIKDDILKAVGEKAIVLDPSEAISRRVNQLLSDN